MPEIDLTPFCSREHYRVARIGRPWSIGPWTYATNGHIAIRVPRRPDTPEHPEAPENIVDLFSRFVSLRFRPLTARVPPTNLPPCRVCRGTGWVVRCRECDGEGTHTCDCPYCDRSCDCCNGNGFQPGAPDTPEGRRITCDECDGTGRASDTRRVHFPGGLVLQARYLALLQDLPGPVEMGVECKDGPQSFRGAGWTALISPLYFADMQKGDIVLDHQEAPADA